MLLKAVVCYWALIVIVTVSMVSVVANAESEESEQNEEETEEESGVQAEEAEEDPSKSGYSYFEFSGPVSGLSEPIYVPDNDEMKLDYYAQPDYHYSYGIMDPFTGNAQEHQESRQGDSVTGHYSVLQADGITRIVTYRADPVLGFQAVIEYH